MTHVATPWSSEDYGVTGPAVPVTWTADDWEALAITLRSVAEARRAPDAIEAQALDALAHRIMVGLEAYDATQYTTADGRTFHPTEQDG